MPTQVVEVDLQTEVGSIPTDTFSDLLVVANDPTVDDPTYADPNVYDTVTQVATDFGDDSDAAEASREIASQGADSWWVVMLESNSETETHALESEDSTEIEQAPLRGGVDTVSAEAITEGTSYDVEPSTESPPQNPDDDQTVAVNFDTGEFVFPEPISDEVEISYETLNWQDAVPEMTAGDFDLVTLANTHADRSYIGELDELVTWAHDNDAGVVAAYESGDAFEKQEDAIEQAHDIGKYIPSGNLLPIAHRASDDIASGVAGRVSTKRPWFDPFYDGGANYSFSMNNYRESLIGSPSHPNTFEGGDDDHGGPANVLHRIEGTQVLTNSLSTAGRASDYQFWDVKRTETFIVSEVNLALRSLRLRREHIPFAPAGKALIEDALRSRLLRYVATGPPALTPDEIDQLDEDEEEEQLRQQLMDQRTPSGTFPGGKPLSQLNVHVPGFSDLSTDDRANRRWSNIVVEAQLAGNVHTFEVELAVHV